MARLAHGAHSAARTRTSPRSRASGQHASAAAASIAASGIAGASAVAGSCTIATPPTSRIARRPAAPSAFAPVSTTPTRARRRRRPPTRTGRRSTDGVLHRLVGGEREGPRPRRAGGSRAAPRTRAALDRILVLTSTTVRRVWRRRSAASESRSASGAGAARATTGRSKSSGSTSSSSLSARSPPNEAPTTTIPYAHRDLPVEPLARVELLVAVGVAREPERLLAAEREDAEHHEALVEQLVHAVLQRAVEVDQHVAADDHVELVERAVRDEVVLREDDVVDERALRTARRRSPPSSTRRTRSCRRRGGSSRVYSCIFSSGKTPARACSSTASLMSVA